MMSSNSSSEYHEMRLEKTHPSGAEEWGCPTCGRRFLIQWPPKYRKIVLEPGDEYALHSASKGGLQMGPLQISQDGDAEDEPILSDELRAALDEVMENIDFDD
jgi:hypothetical protein